MTIRTFFPAALAFLVFFPLSCLRLSGPPDEFTCERNADCESGEKCLTKRRASVGTCVEELYCDEPSDCSGHIDCKNHECVTPKCIDWDDSQCGAYRCDVLSGKCEDSCGYPWECAPGRECVSGECVPCTLSSSCDW